MWQEKEVDSVAYTTAPDEGSPATKGGTTQDGQDMWRVGRDQELNRNFRFLSVLGFSAVLMCTWEAVLFGSGASYGLTDGGKGGMIYTYLGVLVGFSFVILSMAEMASMAPTSGGQYHWVSEFAPPSCQQVLSYITGWVCVLGWHTGIAGCGYTVANMLVGLLAINYPDSYTYEPWHVTLLVIAVTVAALIFNTVFAQKLPLIEGVILIVHCFGFFGILIPLWVLSPSVPPSDVFGSIVDRGGWGSNGLACFVGVVGPIYALIGPDSAVHMSEEIRDASRVLPQAMVWTLILNGATGFVMIVTFAFCVGNIDEVMASTTGFAFIQVFLNSTGSVAAATGMTVVIMIMQFCATISNVATTSRQIYAFARDGGVPFGSFFSRVRPFPSLPIKMHKLMRGQVNSRFMVPLNALFVSLAIVSLLSLINIGSAVAFNAIMSLGTAALLSSYLISISCVRLRRWRQMPLPPARWSMGKLTPFIDSVSLVVLAIVFVFTFFPLTNDTAPSEFNWAIVIFGAVVVLAMGYYVLHARNVYKGPVTRVRVAQ
ncbi:amino acid transporter [Aspergillus ellipticus CBS 707.79]|uniref:Amino acid transporter n=1 Tax=Aspergillus ellipticus CBS 707.79 TaxID=1448320 RepID=A0A319D2F9_9EURO|nr:amino acid transporter [Aspergillus ellipticus CBS 707.79]